MRRPGDLGREDDAPLGRGLGAAAGRFVARRRRQQQHVAVAVDQHRRRQHDVLVDAQARPRAAPARPRPGRAASRGSCRRPSRRRRPRRPRARSTISAGGQPGCVGRIGSPRPRAQRGARLRRTAGHAADLGAALHARVAADRHQAAARGRAGRPRARPTLTSAWTVSTPCACWVRPIDQTKTAFGRSISSRANASIAARVAPLSRSSASHVVRGDVGRAPPRSRWCARRRTRGRRRRRRSSALQHADQEREVAAGVHVEPVVGDARCRTIALAAIDGTQ